MFSEMLHELDRNTTRYMVDDMREKIEKQGETITELQETVAEQQEAMTEKDESIAELQGTVTEQKEAMAEKDESIAELQGTVAEQQEALADKDESITELQRLIAEQQAEINRLLKNRNHAQFTYPVVEISGINTILLTPPIVGEATLTALYDQANLIFFPNTFIYNDFAPFEIE